MKARKLTDSQTDEDIQRAAVSIYNGKCTLGTMYTFLRSCTTDVVPEFPYMQVFIYLRMACT